MLEQEAIKAALAADFKKAVALNEKILKEKPKDFEALNRLAFAQRELGQGKEAAKIYRQLLRLDPYNPIARKNLAKLKDLKIQNPNTKSRNPIIPSLFLAEGEKIKSVDLLNLAPKQILTRLSVGEEVQVGPRGFELQVKTKKGFYLGTFPDDVGRNIINLLKKKVKVLFFIQDIKENSLTVFLKWAP